MTARINPAPEEPPGEERGGETDNSRGVAWGEDIHQREDLQGGGQGKAKFDEYTFTIKVRQGRINVELTGHLVGFNGQNQLEIGKP